MDIWILVIALVVIAIVLLIASFFVDEGSDDLEEKMDEFSSQQSQELYSIKTRLAELEKTQRSDDGSYNQQSDDPNDFVEVRQAQAYDVNNEAEEIENVSDATREQIIRLYSQGYTMHEISQEVDANTPTVQFVVDDYIENR